MPREKFHRFPLAALERYMLMDDQKRFSMTCHMRFWFEGELEQSVFAASLHKALERHPLLSSELRQSRKLALFKTLAFQCVPIVIQEILDWKDGLAPKPPERICLSDMRTKFLVQVNKNQSLLVIKFHHAITDGIGIFQFMEDLMLLYDQETSGKQNSLPPLHVSKLQRRVDFGLTLWDWAKRAHLDVRRLINFFYSFPASLASAPNPSLARGPRQNLSSIQESDVGAVVRISIPYEFISNAHHSAKNLGVTLNDLMIGRLLRSCIDWNRKFGKSVKEWQPFRMNVPISLRNPSEDDMPAANYVSMVFLDRFPKEILAESNLVKSISLEMNQVKRDRMGLTLIMAVTVLMRIKVFGALLRSPLCMATIGLTNLGQPFRNFSLLSQGKVRSGNVTLTALDTLPPVRNKTLATLSVNRYAENLALTMRYDSTRWSARDAGDFLEQYASTLINPESPPLKAVAGFL
ncbi:MAG: hypothetical protein NTV34_07260, partial [Proteobacteria bacterium]|nr:hypothetical protein [Pseudomonadota bacterium]